MRAWPLLAVLVLDAALAGRAWCETPARSPSTVVAALVDGDPANDAVEAAAQEVAAVLHLERTSQAARWRSSVTDDYEAPRPWEEDEAVATVARLCPGATAPAPSSELDRAAATLFRVTGEAPDHRSAPGYGPWRRDVAAAAQAAMCTRRGGRVQPVNVHVFAATGVEWTLFVNGVDVATARGDSTVEVSMNDGQPLWVHARCGYHVRCSRTIRVADPSRPVEVFIEAVGARLHGRMSTSSLGITYASVVERNAHAAVDAALVAYMLAAAHSTRGDAIAVMSEGPELRLVYTNEDGVPLRTLRTSQEAIGVAAERLVAGDSQATVGQWQPGQHRVVVQLHDGAPTVVDAQADLDHAPVAVRRFCTAGRCAFAAPTGTLRLRFDETQWSGPMQKRLELDKDLLVTVRPGRRYWAKYTGLGLMGGGMGGVAAVMLVAGLENALAKGVCDAATSGPDDSCDKDVPASKWETVTFVSSAGAIAVGAFLYFVVHKKPRINVRPLGGAGFAF